VTAGSWVAFSAYAWLLQNAPISQVSTYAYVNPLVAVVLGWAILGESIGGATAIGAALVVVSVAAIVRRENGGAVRRGLARRGAPGTAGLPARAVPRRPTG
jgi:drug/metabolite transporter (DMT)-like permease